MSLELIAIITTSAFQATLLGVGLWMLYQQSQLLERLSGGIWSVFLDGRKERAEIKARIEEVQRLFREELLKK